MEANADAATNRETSNLNGMLPIIQSTLNSRQDSMDVVAFIESLNTNSGAATE
jgi:hypothetical protein